MEKVIKISYWWKDEDSENIKDSHREALENAAWERIMEMAAQGYISGELIDYVRADDDDPENGKAYTGWWSMTTETIK